jgi:hypothetical protein
MKLCWFKLVLTFLGLIMGEFEDLKLNHQEPSHFMLGQSLYKLANAG